MGSLSEISNAEATDEQLVALARQGSSEAFEILTHRYRSRLLVFIERKIHQRHDAEEIVQETLLRTYESLREFDPRFRFSTWIYTIAFRLSLDHLRRRKRWYDWLSQAKQAWKEPQTERRGKDSIADDLWAVARDRLSEPQYQALWLRHGEGQTIEEIASILQKSLGAVRVLLHRAKSILAKDILTRKESHNRSTLQQGNTQ